MRRNPRLPVSCICTVFALAAYGCGSADPGEDHTMADAGTDSDSDSDTDSDTDSDSDSDTDTDTDTCTMGMLDNDVQIETAEDLEQLIGYTSVHGINAFGASITDFTGLECLETIENMLYLEVCYNLTSLEGLDNLTAVGDIYFSNNESLTDLSALQNLAHVSEGGIYLEVNAALTSLAGLEGLLEAGGIHLFDNPSIVGLAEFDNLSSLGSLEIQGSPLLENLDGLENLGYLTWNVYIQDNESLSNLDGLNGLISVGDNIWITDNPALPDCEACELLAQLAEPPTVTVEDNLDDGCTPVPANCDPVPCVGYTGTDECCMTNNPCDWDLNDICDCDSACAWDSVDCEW